MKLPPNEPEPTLLPENILPMSGEAAEELEILLDEKQKDAFCLNRHRRVVVNHHRRALECSDCGKVIDPFDYVLQWAHEGRHAMGALKNIDARRKVAYGQFNMLEKRIDNLRAQLKRLGHPQPQLERQAYRNDLLNAENRA